MAFVVLASGCLTGCNPSKREPVLAAQAQATWPDLPPVDRPTKPHVQAWEYDYPRLTKAAPIPKSTTACLGVPIPQRDASYWARCGVQPIDRDSNIFIGFEREQWDILLRNLQELEAYYAASQERFNAIDKQRDTWRERNLLLQPKPAP